MPDPVKEIIDPEIQWKMGCFSESLHRIKRLNGRILEADVCKVEVFHGSLIAWWEYSILLKKHSSPSVHCHHHLHTLQEDPLRDTIIIIIIIKQVEYPCFIELCVCVWVCICESHPCRVCRWMTGRGQPWRAGTLCCWAGWCCPERAVPRACSVQSGHTGYPVQ